MNMRKLLTISASICLCWFLAFVMIANTLYQSVILPHTNFQAVAFIERDINIAQSNVRIIAERVSILSKHGLLTGDLPGSAEVKQFLHSSYFQRSVYRETLAYNYDDDFQSLLNDYDAAYREVVDTFEEIRNYYDEVQPLMENYEASRKKINDIKPVDPNANRNEYIRWIDNTLDSYVAVENSLREVGDNLENINPTADVKQQYEYFKTAIHSYEKFARDNKEGLTYFHDVVVNGNYESYKKSIEISDQAPVSLQKNLARLKQYDVEKEYQTIIEEMDFQMTGLHSLKSSINKKFETFAPLPIMAL